MITWKFSAVNVITPGAKGKRRFPRYKGHLPGAVSIPLEELERRLSELPEDKGIVAYCRGHYYSLADQAVDLLLAKGYRAQRADDGVVEWKIDGMPVEKS